MLLPREQTIFEINATSRTPASTVMRSKRRHDHALIEKYQRGQQEKRAVALQGQGLCPAPLAPQQGEGEGEEEENLQVMRMRSLTVPGFGSSWLLHHIPCPLPGRVLHRRGPEAKTGPRRR